MVSKCSSIELYPISAAHSFKINLRGLQNSFEKHRPSSHTCSDNYLDKKKEEIPLGSKPAEPGGEQLWGLSSQMLCSAGPPGAL